MSTAFRYCGLEGGACGFGIYAPNPPGDSGKTHAYYDVCAHAKVDGQLGSLLQLHQRQKRLQSFAQMWPKNESDAEIAAQVCFDSAHFDVTLSRGAGLRHSPPTFQLSHPPPE